MAPPNPELPAVTFRKATLFTVRLAYWFWMPPVAARLWPLPFCNVKFWIVTLIGVAV